MSAEGGPAAAPHRAATFCFTDIEGSTALLAGLGPERYEVVLDRHREIIRGAFTGRGGDEVHVEGDGMLFAFDDADGALGATAEAQRGLGEEDWPYGVVPRVRMGLHTGEGARTADGDYIGLAVHQAARIATAANGGQVLVSPATAEAAPTGASLAVVGRYHVRDFPEPVELLQLAGEHLETNVAPRVPLATPRNFPAVATTFVGRSADVDTLAGLVRRRPLVTLVGPGGVGKTRLALEVAARMTGEFSDGVWLVELGGLEGASADSDTVAAAVARTIGVATSAGVPVVDTVVADLTSHPRLLVLDACEHVLDAVASLVDAVSQREGQTVFLATSREALSVRAEQRWPVDTLTQADAERLFLDRAAAIDPSFPEHDENRGLVAALCQRLDGIPLAIELAAARLGELDIEQLAVSLERVLDLAGGYRTDAPRHRTMRALVAWSVDGLSPTEQAVYRRLAPLRGSNPRDAAVVAAGAVSDLAVNVDHALGGLVAKSLLIIESEGRVRMLDPIREHAADLLGDSGEEHEVMATLLEWVIERRNEGIGVARKAQPAPHNRAELNIDTLRLLLVWSEAHDPPSLARLVVTLQLEFVLMALWDEGRRWLDAAISVTSPDDVALRAALFYVAASIAMHQSDTKGVRDFAEQSLELAERAIEAEKDGRTTGAPSPVDPTTSLQSAANALGVSLWQERRLDEAEAMFARAAELSTPHSSHYATVMLNMANVHIGRGDLAAAERALRDAVVIFDDFPIDPNGVAARFNLAAIRGMAGDHDGAARELEAGLERALQSDQLRHVLPMAETNLGIARRHLGDPRALDTLRSGVRRAREFGDLRMLLVGLRALVEHARHESDLKEVRRLADDIVAVASRVPDDGTAVWATAVLAATYQALGDSARATGHRHAAIDLARGLPFTGSDATDLLVELAGALAAPAPEHAARLLGAAAAALPPGLPASPAYQAQVEAISGNVAPVLMGRVEALIEEGRSLDVNAALALARDA